MVLLPFSEFPSFTQEILLDNIPYKFNFKWNTRGEYWQMPIYDREENLLISVKIVLTFELLSLYRHFGGPQGELYALPMVNNVDRIERDSIGDTVELVYITVDELS